MKTMLVTFPIIRQLLHQAVDTDVVKRSQCGVCADSVRVWLKLCEDDKIPREFFRCGLGSVKDRVSVEGLCWNWKREPRSEAELTELCNLSQLLGGVFLSPRPDSVTFSFSFDSIYKVAVVRKFLDSRIASAGDSIVCCLSRITAAVPLRVRGVNLESDSCIICNESAQSVDHALVECASASEVRRLIFGWCGVSPCSFSSIVDLLDFGARR
ncbi:hypothetical protein L1887_09936 [Cichorium endivia]|nr:hypothetical protein L1887_09936 [Cichorium endivia]